MVDRNSFFLGFLLGAVLIAVIGYIFQQIYLLRTKKIIAGKKQRIEAYTESTPSEVVRKSGAAQVQVVLLFLVLLGLVAGCFWVVSSLFAGQ